MTECSKSDHYLSLSLWFSTRCANYHPRGLKHEDGKHAFPNKREMAQDTCGKKPNKEASADIPENRSPEVINLMEFVVSSHLVNKALTVNIAEIVHRLRLIGLTCFTFRDVICVSWIATNIFP